MTAAIYWALAATIFPYLITKPSHVRALLAFFWIYCFGQSVVNYSGATDIEIPSSAMFALLFFLFFATVTHSPLTWLSIILYEDPYKHPVSQRPRPFSLWFRRPRQLTPPPYSGSQAPDAAASPERMSQQIKDLTEALRDAKSLVMTYMRYVPMYETSQSRIHELEAQVEALKGDAKAHKEEKVYFKAERAMFEKERAKDKAYVDKCETTIQKLMEKRDQRIQTRVCRWCKSQVNSLTRVVEDMTKKNSDDTTETRDDAAAEAMAAKDKIIAEKDIIIAFKDKIISAKGRDALLQVVSADMGESKQASLYAHIGELDEQLRVTNCEVARLNKVLDERRYCCCGCCGGRIPPAFQITADSLALTTFFGATATEISGGLNDDGDDGTTNGGPAPQGGNAQPPMSASEPSGAPPCSVAEPSNPPSAAAPSSGDPGAGASLAPAPTTPAPIPISAVEIPLPPFPAPSTGPTVPDPAALVPLPASPPASVPVSPIPVAAPLVTVPTSPAGQPSNPPSTTAGAPSGDDDGTAGASIPPEPGTAMSSPLSSSPPSPIPISAIPTLFPGISAPLTAPAVSEPAPMVPLPTSPTTSTANPVSVPEPSAPEPARTLFAPATAGFGPSSTSIFVPVPPATGTSGPPPPTNGT